MRLPPVDKQGHFWAGMALYLAFSHLSGMPISSAALVIFIAFLREHFGNEDMDDFTFTIVGILVGIVVQGIKAFLL